MNNKSAKKHKPKCKKKEPQSKKKKEIKSGGAFSIPLFVRKKKVNLNEQELQPLLQNNNEQVQQPSSQITNIQPNAQPQGFNTIKSTSRCSIL
jgi:hypothetical protein